MLVRASSVNNDSQKPIVYMQTGRPRICQGADHGECGAWAWGLGQSPMGPRHRGKRGALTPLSWMPFVHFHTKEGPKDMDLTDRLSPCLRQTVSCSHDWPLLLVNGRRPSPPMRGCASACKVCFTLTVLDTLHCDVATKNMKLQWKIYQDIGRCG